MSSEIKADKWSPASGTSATIGDSGDTYTVPTGANFTVTDELKTNKISPASGTSFTLGDSGDTFTVPSGVTFANSGTATGFGGTNTPSFFARNTSHQDITHGVDTKVIVDSEFFDTDGCFNNTGSTATLNGISVPSYSFAPNIAGKYFFSFTGSFSDDSATSSNLAYFVMRISVNDVWKTRNVFNLNNNQGRQGTGTLTLLIDLDGVDDYVNFQAEVGTTDSSTARIMGDYVRVNGFKLI